MARRTYFSLTVQRTVSFLTGETRERPIHPLRSQGIVQIGNRYVRVEQPITAWNEAKQASRPHECAAAQMGMMCGHA